MSLTVLHSRTATTPDDPAYEIRPSHWNEGHVVSGPLVEALSAGTSSATGTIVLANSNGVTFGMSAGTVTASVAAGGGGGIAGAAGTQTATSGTVVFANSNGLTFGMSGSSQITASHNGLTSMSTAPGAVAAGTQTATSGTIVFSNSNGVTFGMSGSSRITASYSQSTAPGGFAAGTQTQTVGTLVLSNSNGISFGMSNSSVVTASYSVPTQTVQSLGLYAVSNTTGAASSTTADARSLSFQGAGIASVGYSAGSVVISVPAGGGGGDGVNILAAGTQTANTTGTVVFSNSNGVTFGMNNSSVITASVAAAGGGVTESQVFAVEPHGGTSTASVGQSSLYLQPMECDNPASVNRIERMVSLSFSSHTRTTTASISSYDSVNGQTTSSSASVGQTNSFIMSVSAGLYSLGTGTNNTRLESYYTNSMTFGVTQAYTYGYTGAISQGNGINTQTYFASATCQAFLSIGAIRSIDTTGGVTTTQWTATQQSSASLSTSAATTITTSTSVSCSQTLGSVLSGLKAMVMPFATSFSGGNWWLADIAITSSTSAGSKVSNLSASRMNLTTQTSAWWMMGATTTNKSNGLFMGQGVLSVATAAMPATIALADISARSNEQYFAVLKNQPLL